MTNGESRSNGERARESVTRGFCRGWSWLQVAASMALIASPSRAVADATTPPFHLLRYDDNYSYLAHRQTSDFTPWEDLKYIPLDRESPGGPFVSVGGEVRFQYIERWNDQFGRIPGAQGSLQQRYLWHADLVGSDQVRIFGQLISAWEQGRKPTSLPTDVDHLDVQQLFAELKSAPDAAAKGYLRIGRQEILLAGHQLLKIREGPDVRLSFNGARAHVAQGDFDSDLFTANVVQPRAGLFDDSWTDHSVTFAGLNLGWHPKLSGLANVRADAFVFDYRNRSVRYEQFAGTEHRQTYGLRASGRSGSWEFDYEGSLQSGTLGPLAIRAWGVAFFTSYHWDSEPTKPKLTLGLSSVTGDRNRSDREINTFNCLFARGDYFGDTSLLTGSNTLDLSLLTDRELVQRLHVSIQWDRLWRSETTDGLYAPPLIYVRSGLVSDSRDIGNQFTLTATLSVNRFVTVQLIGSAFVAGDFIKAGPTKTGTEGLTMRTQFKF